MKPLRTYDQGDAWDSDVPGQRFVDLKDYLRLRDAIKDYLLRDGFDGGELDKLLNREVTK